MAKSATNIEQVGYLGTAALMMKTQIGLGVLSIPAVFDVLGLIPGVLCLIAIAFITTWSDYIVGIFKLNHPEVYGIDDVGRMLFGRIGREFLGVAFVLCKYCCSHDISLLTSCRLDICCRRRNAWCFDRFQFAFYSWCLHCGVCSHSLCYRLWTSQYPDP